MAFSFYVNGVSYNGYLYRCKGMTFIRGNYDVEYTLSSNDAMGI